MAPGRSLPVFALAFAVLVMGPCVLGIPLPGFPLMAVADALDLFTPVVLLPLYGWLMYEAHGVPGPRRCALFLALAGLWVEGQGIHLAANSVGHHLTDAVPPALRSIVHFYDEGLSHALWHTGVVGLSALCLSTPSRPEVCAQTRCGPALAHDVLALPLACGAVYGFTFFCMVIEGATAVLGVPFAVGAVLYALLRVGPELRRRPVSLFFASGYAFADLLFLAWGVWWGGLPEFSAVGLI